MSKCLSKWINWIISKSNHNIWNILFVLFLTGRQIRKCLFFKVKIFKNNSVDYYTRTFRIKLKSSDCQSWGLKSLWIDRSSNTNSKSIYLRACQKKYFELTFSNISFHQYLVKWLILNSLKIYKIKLTLKRL